MAVSFVITCLLSLINLGSAVAFNAIVSLAVGAILSSYIISISCLAIKRFRGHDLPNARWSLGRPWGAICNIVSVCFLLVVWIFAFFPLATPVTLESMNWSVLIYGTVLVFSIFYYIVFARHVYTGPVALIERVQAI